MGVVVSFWVNMRISSWSMESCFLRRREVVIVETMKRFPMDIFEEGDEKLTGIQVPPLQQRDMEFQQTAQ